MTVQFFLEDQSLGRYGEFRESLSLHLLFFKCLQLKIINIPKQPILGWHVQKSHLNESLRRTEALSFLLTAGPLNPELSGPQEASETYLLAVWNWGVATKRTECVSDTERLLDSSLQYNHGIAVVIANLFQRLLFRHMDKCSHGDEHCPFRGTSLVRQMCTHPTEAAILIVFEIPSHRLLQNSEYISWWKYLNF